MAIFKVTLNSFFSPLSFHPIPIFVSSISNVGKEILSLKALFSWFIKVRINALREMHTLHTWLWKSLIWKNYVYIKNIFVYTCILMNHSKVLSFSPAPSLRLALFEFARAWAYALFKHNISRTWVSHQTCSNNENETKDVNSALSWISLRVKIITLFI